MRTIAIIGSGPTAIYTARYLLSKGEALSITMYEAQSEAGKGTPYHQDWNEREMLANIASIELPPVTETLEQWLQDKHDDDLEMLGVMREDIHERAFLPRVVLGGYFHAQLAKFVQDARPTGNAIRVLTSHKVLDVQAVENGIELAVYHDGIVHHDLFDYVVMATGHAWPVETEMRTGYFLSPWPAAALRTIGNVHVGIRGTSLSAIDALVALAVARGSFRRDEHGELHYLPEPETEGFHVTMMSRKGLLPEADFYHTIPYEPLAICTEEAVDRLVAAGPHEHLLDEVFALFKAELAQADPDYAGRIGLAGLTLEDFSKAYFREREEADPFAWAEYNLIEAKRNHSREHTVPWRYAILRMHEVIARAVPHLLAEDHQRFNAHFKQVFVDDYATVPHESIERLLAMNRADKLAILKLGEEYALDTETPQTGALLMYDGKQIHFPAFIEAMGQRALSLHDFPFPGLWKQGLLQKATTPYFADKRRFRPKANVGGIALDAAYHPLSGSPYASRLYCLSLPFMLGQFPFAQGITSSHDMGKTVAEDMIKQFSSDNVAEMRERKSA